MENENAFVILNEAQRSEESVCATLTDPSQAQDDKTTD